MRRAVLLAVSVVVAILLASGVALAALSNVPDPNTVGANGRIWDILVAGDTIYLAGAFTQITDEDGTIFQRNNLAAVDAATGQVTSWNPSATNPNNPANSSVRSLALSSDGTRLFVGGTFLRVGGLFRGRLAAVNPFTGAVDGAWQAHVDRPVYALTVSGNRLYVGGDFTAVAGEPRERLAAVEATTAALDPNWKPRAYRGDDAKATVWAMDVSADGTLIYAGGRFNHISDVRTEKLAALDATSGAVDPVFAPATPNHIIAMDVSGGDVYVGTGDPLEGIESFDATTGQLRWSVPGGHPDPAAGDVQAITVWGDTVYAGGHFGQMGGLIRKRLVEVDAATGQIGPWAPEVPGGNVGVWALEPDPSHGGLYAGGDFTEIAGQTHERFARFSKIENCTIVGTPNDDVLEGTSGPDVICGGGGNDTLKGLGGNDILRGGGDHDTLMGGPDDDTLDGGPGIDSVDFSGSSAAITASLAENTATGEGSDTLANLERLFGSKHDDTLTGSGANNVLRGNGGADTLNGLEGADNLYGGGAGDLLSGESGNDSLVGGGGADELFGDDDDDTLDSLDGVNANDSLDGGDHSNGDTCITDATEKSILNCEQ